VAPEPSPVDPEPTGATADSTAPLVDAPVADAGGPWVVEVGQPLTLATSTSGPDGVLWDFGDGAQSTDPEPTHTWQAPGTYTLVVQATGLGGDWVETDTARVVVHPPFALTPPSVSSSVAIGADGLVYTVEPDGGTLLRTDGGAATTRIDVCDQPRTVAVAGGVLAVACEGDGRLVLRDEASLSELGEVALGQGARPFAVTGRDGRRWWVSDAGRDELVEVVDGEVVATHPLTDPRHLAAMVQPYDLQVPTRVVAPRWRSPDDLGRIERLDEPELTLAYDPGPDSDTSIRGVPHLFGQLAMSVDAGVVYLPGTLANTARGGWRDGQPLTHETTMHAALFAVDLATGEEVLRKQFDDQGEAGSVALSPYGDIAYVVFPGTQTVLAVDAFDGDIVGSVLTAGHDIDGVAVSADGATLYLHAALDRQLRAYDVSDLSRVPPLLWAVPTVDAEPLPAEVLLGKRLFHDAADLRMARDGYIRCASCHPDGGHDALVWDFTDRGEGLRNTIDLRGKAGTAMGPLHWSANFDEVHDFEHDIRGPFQGTGLMTDADFAATSDPLGAPKAGRSADLDALAAYVTSLDEPLPPTETALVTGPGLFEVSGCAECHPPPLYTDSPTGVRHDVGTLGEASGQRLGGELDGIDTPTLLGVSHSGPWLHDGSASTLEEALQGHADGLAAPGLVDFLRSL
jgi:hypothetical protein